MTLGAAGLGAAGIGASAGLGSTYLTADLVGDTTRQVFAAIRAGSITGISIQLSEPRTSGSVTARVTVNGVPAALFAQVNTATDHAYATQTYGISTFDAGDEIGVELELSSDWLPTTADATMMVEVETSTDPAPATFIITESSDFLTSESGSLLVVE